MSARGIRCGREQVRVKFRKAMLQSIEMKRSLEAATTTDDLAEQIAAACHTQFDLLSARGKPSPCEWTHLAGFVTVDEQNAVRVLSLGTGTKCLGGEKDERGTQGCLLHDSHAEVIARRALMRLLYDELQHDGGSLLVKQEEEQRFEWNASLRLHLFVSYPPCGSAAHLSEPVKRPKLEHKSLQSSAEEELYLKPGKGSQTTSLSCTNKINRWVYQGLEGSLLSQFIRSPIKLAGLAIQTTADLSPVFTNVSVASVEKSFDYGPSSQRVRPCATSIAWWSGLDVSSPIVTVDGYPLGQVKKLRHKQQYASSIAKCSFLKLYLQLKSDLSPTTTTYAEAKAVASNALRSQFMTDHPQWPTTDANVFYSFTLAQQPSDGKAQRSTTDQHH